MKPYELLHIIHTIGSFTAANAANGFNAQYLNGDIKEESLFNVYKQILKEMINGYTFDKGE
jgi:hypothetical protein